MAKDDDINLDVVQDIISTIKMIREKYGLTLEQMERHVGIVYSAMKTPEVPPAH